MIRVQRTRRVFVGLLVCAALVAAGCELEAEPEASPPARVDHESTTTTAKQEVTVPSPDKPPVQDKPGQPAPGEPLPDKPDQPDKPDSPTPTPSTTAPPPPTTNPPATDPPPTDPPPTHGGMPHVDASAIPSGSSGTDQVRIGSGAGAPRTDDIQGAVVMFCDFSHMNFDDPIVFPGVRDATHLHAFFGNTGTDYRSTAGSIRGSGNSTCVGGTANRSAYWVPAMIDTRSGTPLRPREVVIYYTHGNLPGPEIQAHPAGLRILAGRASSTGPQSMISYWCHSGGYQSTIPTNCGPDDHLKINVEFPQCWNGRDLDSADHASHMAYSTRSGCPSSHPVAIPRLQLSAIWELDGQPSSAIRLSSDMYSSDQPAGYSGHADWFDGWDESVKVAALENCINREVYCPGQLGDGRSLQRS